MEKFDRPSTTSAGISAQPTVWYRVGLLQVFEAIDAGLKAPLDFASKVTPYLVGAAPPLKWLHSRLSGKDARSRGKAEFELMKQVRPGDLAKQSIAADVRLEYLWGAIRGRKGLGAEEIRHALSMRPIWRALRDHDIAQGMIRVEEDGSGRRIAHLDRGWYAFSYFTGLLFFLAGEALVGWLVAAGDRGRLSGYSIKDTAIITGIILVFAVALMVVGKSVIRPSMGAKWLLQQQQDALKRAGHDLPVGHAGRPPTIGMLMEPTWAAIRGVARRLVVAVRLRRRRRRRLRA